MGPRTGCRGCLAGGGRGCGLWGAARAGSGACGFGACRCRGCARGRCPGRGPGAGGSVCLACLCTGTAQSRHGRALHLAGGGGVGVGAWGGAHRGGGAACVALPGGVGGRWPLVGAVGGAPHGDAGARLCRSGLGARRDFRWWHHPGVAGAAFGVFGDSGRRFLIRFWGAGGVREGRGVQHGPLAAGGCPGGPVAG